MSVVRNVWLAVFLAAIPVTASAQCPSYAELGVHRENYSADAARPLTITFAAGGRINLSECQRVPGHGYIEIRPDFTIQYDPRGMGRTLSFRGFGECDTVLLVNTATGQWLFNDDFSGDNPSISLPNAPVGRYDIWIGTYGPQWCMSQFQIEAF